MPIRLFLLILLSVGLSAAAQLSLKVGITAARTSRAAGVGSELGSMLLSPMVILGLGLYGVGALLWLFVLGRVQLSLAYPFVGLGFILTMLAGALVLNEPLGFSRVAGACLIIAGCVLVARTA
jgi:multidrug transporter EmrE-like cation transporter